MITHRCRGSLKARVSIRYAYQWPYMLRSPSEKQAWRMITYGVDDEYMDIVIKTSDTEINFCPFCGQNLEAPEQLTDKEQRIFLAAMGREEKVCKQVDEECSREPYEDSLVRICHEITRKVKGALWT